MSIEINALKELTLKGPDFTKKTGPEKFNIKDPQKKNEEESPPPPPVLKKFLVHFRRPSTYKGEYGFDWLRDEYIYPITTISGTPKELSLDINKIKTEYKTTDVLNPITPHQKDYYCSWLNIRLNQEVELDIEVEELEPLTNDATEIIFESSNPKLTITPQSIPLSTFIATGKKTKNLGAPATNRDYYLATNQIKIKCDGAAFTKNEQIKIFAKLDEEKVEVGKLMVLKNSDEDKYTINVYAIYSYLDNDPAFNRTVVDTEIAKVGGLSAIEDYLNKQSLNQALIKIKLISDPSTDWIFKRNTILMVNQGIDPQTGRESKDYNQYKGMVINTTSMLMDTGKYMDYINDRFKLKYSKLVNQKAMFLYLTPFESPGSGGGGYQIPLNNKHVILFKTNLDHLASYAHEIGHTLGLDHTFLDKDASCNLISQVNAKININKRITDHKLQVQKAKQDIENQWNQFKQKNSAYFAQLSTNSAEYKEYRKPYDDAIAELNKGSAEYEKNRRDEIELLDKNNIRFIRAFTENIMDYWSDDNNCDGTKDIAGITKKISFNKYQWKIMQEEAKKYYH